MLPVLRLHVVCDPLEEANHQMQGPEPKLVGVRFFGYAQSGLKNKLQQKLLPSIKKTPAFPVGAYAFGKKVV